MICGGEPYGEALKSLREIGLWDEDYTRFLLRELRKQLLGTSPAPEQAEAATRFDELLQAFYSLKIQQRNDLGGISRVEKTKAAMLEMGSRTREAEAITLHLVNRGVLD